MPVSEHLSAAINNSNLLDTTKGMYSAAVKALAATADYRDTLSMDHSERVSALAGRLAEEMGFREEEIEIIRLAGFVHDVGKIGIPDSILQKPGPLDPHERQVVKTHAELGASILDRAGLHPDVGSMVLHHHEWHDGSGYPGRLSGNSIPAGAAILAVSDAFDTMVSDRSYKTRISVHEALDEVNRCAGGQFDPLVSQALDKVVRRALEMNEPWLRDLMGGGSVWRPPDFANTANASSESAINSKELEVLFRIAQEMKKLLDLDELLKHMANLITEKMGYTDCLILIPDENGDNLVIAAAVGMSGGIVGMRVPKGTGVSWWVMTNGKAQNVGDVTEDPRYYETVDGVGSEVYVPLEVRGKRLGVLVVQKAEIHGFGANDVRLMLAVAGHIASALEVAQLHERVKRSADSDALTGLYNRRVFLSNLENSVRRASQGDYGGVVTVGILDVNLMKEVNDFHGHLTGDAVLSRIGAALATGFRVCDVVARYAGDEFVVLLPGASAEAASKRIEEVIDQWSETTVETPAHETIKMPGACFGIATYPGDGVDARVLLSVADDRLLCAKKVSGKGRLPATRP